MASCGIGRRGCVNIYTMELYKLLQQQGFGSRNQCRKLILSGQIEIAGEVVTDPATGVDPDTLQEILVQGERWTPLRLPLYLMLHKPAGYETSHQPSHYQSVFSLLPDQLRKIGIIAVGRLDADTTGILLLTTNGQFAHALTAPRRHVPKCYRVGLKHPAGAELVERLRAGVLLHDDDTPVVADAVEGLDDTTILLTISEGRYHQVKRMVAAAGNRVISLHRETIGGIQLGDLPLGEWRQLTDAERQSLGF
jgi:16S rRNA pseudouridine516 synthase